MLRVAARIGDQIAEAPPQSIRSNLKNQFGGRDDRQRRPVAPRRRRQILDQQPDIGLDRGFGPLAAGEIEVGIDQRLHLGDIGVQFRRNSVVGDQRQRQLHTGQRRAQIVRHAGEHFGALTDLTLDAVAHPDERGGRLPDLESALDLCEDDRASLPEPVRGRREPAQRFYLIAQENAGDAKQDHRRADHPKNKNIGGGCIQAAERYMRQQETVVELDRDQDILIVICRIDGKRPADSLDHRSFAAAFRASSRRPAENRAIPRRAGTRR